jgi:flagellar assembly factor FliW
MQQILVEEKMSSMEGMLSLRGAKKASKDLRIESRFGPVSIQPENAISFPHGMPGMPGALRFCIADMPNIKHDQFKLFQCLDEYKLSFIVVPSTFDNQLLEPDDVEDACAVLGISRDNLLLLFIVTSHETPAGRRLSVNAKAPVFIDAKNKLATQYVFQGNGYEIQHFIS